MSDVGADATAPLVRVAGLSIAQAGDASLKLVDDVSFEIGVGETVGLVGESGSGKSLTAKALVSLLPPTLRASGSIQFDGTELLGADSRRRASEVRGRGIGLVMQDPFTMLNPVLTAGAHIAETIRQNQGRRAFSGQAMKSEIARRLAEVGIDDAQVAKRYPFELSGGMSQRVALAATLAGDPRLLIADESTTALDTTTQRDILKLIQEIQQRRRMSLLLITHDLRLAFSVCTRVMVMYAGSKIEDAPATALREAPAHPYSRGLLLSVPRADRYEETLHDIPGTVPTAVEVADQCGFASRCPYVRDICLQGKPPLVPIGPAHSTACLRADDLREELSGEVESTAAGVRRAAAGGPVLLNVSGLRKTFRTGRTERVALDDVRLDVRAGESLGVVGESGSGKSTLIRCLLGLLTPDAGTVELDGVDISDYGKLGRTEELSVRRMIQCVFQDPYSSLNPMHSIGFTLDEALRRRARTPDDLDAATGELLRLVGLPESTARRRPSALSGGQRQRVAIARALALQPQLLVCDEPVASLDVSVAAQVLQLLRSINQSRGTSLLFITHDLGVVRQVTDRIVVLYRGQIVEQGPTDQVLDDPQHAYTRQLIDAAPRTDAAWL